MIRRLADEKCVSCREGDRSLSGEELAGLLEGLPLWKAQSRDGVPRLIKEYTVQNFAEAMELAQRVARLAEENDHHPSLLVEWGRVTVAWWTHKIRGLHRNDFIMAAKTDRLTELPR